jgi:hypothetical protein
MEPAVLTERQVIPYSNAVITAAAMLFFMDGDLP